jgi:ATP-dependent Clp protease ATP-binding subunit ClpC
LGRRTARNLGHPQIGTEHILLGLIREGQGLAARILTDAGVELAALKDDVVAAIG